MHRSALKAGEEQAIEVLAVAVILAALVVGLWLWSGGQDVPISP